MTDIPQRPRNQYGDEMTVLDMCLSLHMCNTGSILFDPSDCKELIEFLEWKLNNWIPNECAFDTIVKKLIEATLVECNTVGL